MEVAEAVVGFAQHSAELLNFRLDFLLLRLELVFVLRRHIPNSARQFCETRKIMVDTVARCIMERELCCA